MVKLFVGNLAECVDSHRLRNLFLGVVNVQECDVLKNFAFVHVASDEDATMAIDRLDKTMLEGREIHIERSTSRLRKEPGMSDKCFTCGANDHKTPQCPQEQGRRRNKRPGEENDNSSTKRSNFTPTNTASSGGGGSCWGYKVAAPNDGDSELPCPTNPELKTLYDQYMEARTRYHYFRERLSKELSLQPNGPTPVGNGPMNFGRIDLTRPAPAPVQPVSVPAYGAPTAQPTRAYPGASAPAYNTPPQYRAPMQQTYPAAQPTAVSSASYPGAQQPGGYSTQQIAYGGAQKPPSYQQQAPAPVQYQPQPAVAPVAGYNPPVYQRPAGYQVGGYQNGMPR